MAKAETFNDYLKSEDPQSHAPLKQMRAIIRKAAPNATERLAWGMPTFDLEGILVTFAAFTKHMSLFPGPNAMEHFKKDFGSYVTSKGTVQFPFGEKLPTALISRIVKYRVKANLANAKAKAGKKKAQWKTSKKKVAKKKTTKKKK